jgi:hypothetical protein
MSKTNRINTKMPNIKESLEFYLARCNYILLYIIKKESPHSERIFWDKIFKNYIKNK